MIGEVTRLGGQPGLPDWVPWLSAGVKFCHVNVFKVRTAVQGFIFSAKILLFQAAIEFYAYKIKYF